MEATVTISLKELEELKALNNLLKKRIGDLEELKDIKITIDAKVYDNQYVQEYGQSRVLVFGNLNSLKINQHQDLYKEFRQILQTTFDCYINRYKEDSIELKFYNKFPKWFREFILTSFNNNGMNDTSI